MNITITHTTNNVRMKFYYFDRECFLVSSFFKNPLALPSPTPHAIPQWEN